MRPKPSRWPRRISFGFARSKRRKPRGRWNDRPARPGRTPLPWRGLPPLASGRRDSIRAAEIAIESARQSRELVSLDRRQSLRGLLRRLGAGGTASQGSARALGSRGGGSPELRARVEQGEAAGLAARRISLEVEQTRRELIRIEAQLQPVRKLVAAWCPPVVFVLEPELPDLPPAPSSPRSRPRPWKRRGRSCARRRPEWKPHGHASRRRAWKPAGNARRTPSQNDPDRWPESGGPCRSADRERRTAPLHLPASNPRRPDCSGQRPSSLASSTESLPSTSRFGKVRSPRRRGRSRCGSRRSFLRGVPPGRSAVDGSPGRLANGPRGSGAIPSAPRRSRSRSPPAGAAGRCPMKLLQLVVLAACSIAVGCRGCGSIETVAEEEGWAVTAWGEHFEIFDEAAPLVAGEPYESHTHVTVLSGFQPLQAGVVRIVLSQGAQRSVFEQATPKRPGIYGIEVVPPRRASSISPTRSRPRRRGRRSPAAGCAWERPRSRRSAHATARPCGRHLLPEGAAVADSLRHRRRRSGIAPGEPAGPGPHSARGRGGDRPDGTDRRARARRSLAPRGPGRPGRPADLPDRAPGRRRTQLGRADGSDLVGRGRAVRRPEPVARLERLLATRGRAGSRGWEARSPRRRPGSPEHRA